VAHDDRTCLACLADEGHLYPVTEPIFDHTNGRCSSIPQISGMPELQFQTGEEWIDTLDEDEQRQIMGNARYEAWKDGTPFKEFVTFSEHPTWGRSLTPTPVGKLSGVKVTGGPRMPKAPEPVVPEPVVIDSDKLANKFLDYNDLEWSDIDSADAGKIKHEIITELSRRTGVEYDDVNEFIAQWAKTSGNGDGRSLYLHVDAAKELNKPLSEYIGRKVADIESKPAGLFQQLTDVSDPRRSRLLPAGQQRRLVRAMYENTQTELRQAGFELTDKITLRRGVILSTDEVAQVAAVGDSIPVHGNIIESWSVSEDIAKQFAGGGGHPFAPTVGPKNIGMVLEMDFPVSDIIGSARTGWGCIAEGEFIVTNSEIGKNAKIVKIFAGG